MRRWMLNVFAEPINIFTVLLVIATGGVGIVGYLQWKTLDKTDLTLNLQQRAWAIPVSLQLNKDAVFGTGLSVGVFFINGGREPARNQFDVLQVDEIDSYDPATTDTRTIVVPPNKSCDGIRASPGGFSIPPNNVVTRMQFNSVFARQTYVASERVLKGEKFAVVQGCLAYTTSNKERTSSYCFIIAQHPEIPAPGIKYIASTCGGGFYAD